MTIEDVLQSAQMGEIIDELKGHWEAEQNRRHAFWKDHPDNVKAEFISGEILYHSPVKLRHQIVSQAILRQLFVWETSGFIGYEKMMIRCTRNDYEPDICFWSAEKAAQFKPDQHTFPPPDLAVEILSESTEARDRGIKFEDYALHGIREYWIVDPENCTIEQYLLKNNEQSYYLVLKLKIGQVPSVAMPGFVLAVEKIWPTAP